MLDQMIFSGYFQPWLFDDSMNCDKHLTYQLLFPILYHLQLLAEGALCPVIQVVNEDFKWSWPQCNPWHTQLVTCLQLYLCCWSQSFEANKSALSPPHSSFALHQFVYEDVMVDSTESLTKVWKSTFFPGALFSLGPHSVWFFHIDPWGGQSLLSWSVGLWSW